MKILKLPSSLFILGAVKPLASAMGSVKPGLQERTGWKKLYAQKENTAFLWSLEKI